MRSSTTAFNLNLATGLILLAFVVSHLAAHASLLVSLEFAEPTLALLMEPWRTRIGTVLLAGAAAIHLFYALRSIYVRRTLRMAKWEAWQLALGFCIPLLLMTHVVSTRVAELTIGTTAFYSSTLVSLWVLFPTLGVLQVAALITVWVHACIGVHFWLRMRLWYPVWRSGLAVIALLLPTLALAGFVSGGNQVLRAAKADPQFVQGVLDDANQTDASRARIGRMAQSGFAVYGALVLLPFGARLVRGYLFRRRRPPQLSCANGQRFVIHPGSSVLETLRENAISHAAVCGGRARCTTCRVLVTRGLDDLPAPEPREAKALARVNASPATRLACQLRPTADIAVVPLLAADAGTLDGAMRGGLEGSERMITVIFVDLRASTTIAENRLPYDVLFLLNRFFQEMTAALAETNGHYSQFTGDGLMALYGLTGDPKAGAADAIRGAAAMMDRLAKLNNALADELPQPLRMGIGIHYSEAIVGAMGPPRSQIVSAIGDTVNTCARLESLTKDHDCALIVSRQAADAAGLDVSSCTLLDAPVKGRSGTVRFYALQEVPAFMANDIAAA